MVKVTLKGNFNVPIADLGLEFNPDNAERIISKEDYENSADLKYFADFFDVEDTDKKVAPKKVVKEEKKVAVQEISSPKDEDTVIDATDASLSNVSKEAKKKAEEKQDEEVIDATGASKTQAKKVEEEVKTEEVKVETTPKKEVKKTETKTVEKKKAGRPKKVK